MPEENPCYVYIIETTSGAYKIGVANNPEGRYNTLLTGIPDASRLVFSIWCAERRHAFAVEKILHRELEPYHSSGEWFKPPKEVLAVLLFDLGKKFENIHALILEYPALASLPYQDWRQTGVIVTKMNRVLAEIKALEVDYSSEGRAACTPRELAVKRLNELGYDGDAVIDQMRRDGDIFEPRMGFLKVP